MRSIVLFPVIGYILHYLLARATITGFLWSRYPPRFDTWASCAACCGTWTTAVAGWIGVWKGWDFFGLYSNDVLYWIAVAFWGMFWTPILAYIHIHTLIHTQGASNGGE